MHKGRVVFGAMDEVVFGRPASDVIVEQMDRLGATRAFLMVSGTLNRETNVVKNIRDVLGSRCVGTFDAMPAHTPRAAVVSATEQARSIEADLIVTVGGGSITDGAKAVQLCLANDITTVEGIDRIRAVRGAPPPMNPPTVRQIQRANHHRRRRIYRDGGRDQRADQGQGMLRHRLIMPRAVILDPAIGPHTPEWLWLSTGIRAVDHCVEGICSRESQPYGDAQALKGLSLLAQALPRVKADLRDLDARMNCQIGTWLSTGPLAAGVPMGASHGIGYVLGAEFGVPHGHTSCVMLPFVMRWNKPANAERQALVAAAMGHPGKDAGDVLDDFIRGLGMPRSLREVKVSSEHFDRISVAAMATPWVPRNPRKIDGPAQVREILELAA